MAPGAAALTGDYLRQPRLGGGLVARYALALVVVAGSGEGSRGAKGSRLLWQLMAEGVDYGAIVGVNSGSGLNSLAVEAEGLEGVETNGGCSGLHWGCRLLDWGGAKLGWGRLRGWAESLGGCLGRSVTLAGPVTDGLNVNIGLGGDLYVDVGLSSGGKVGVLGVGHNGSGLLERHGRAASSLVEGVGKSDLGLLDLRGVSDVLGSGSGSAEQTKDAHEALHD